MSASGPTHAGDLTLHSLRVRAVDVRLHRPLQTAVAEIPTAPLALIDLQTAEGITGSSFVFCYTRVGLAGVAATLRELGASLRGEPIDPVPLWRDLRRAATLPGTKGVLGIALGGIDMAAWDAAARAAGVPLAKLLGGTVRERIPAYASLRSVAPGDLAEEAAEELGGGYTAFKVKVGAGDIGADLEVIGALRGVVGEDAAVMVDYNQSLLPAGARVRCRRLDDERLAWIEEPIAADDIEGMARLTRETSTPIQAGESWWSPREASQHVVAGAVDLAMPDAARIGGVTGWLRAAAIAEAAGVPVSSHLYPEVSRHLLAATPGAHLLEHLDLAGRVLRDPVRVEGGHVTIPDTAGIGLEWDEDAVSEFALDL